MVIWERSFGNGTLSLADGHGEEGSTEEQEPCARGGLWCT
jgi:hypothetical protein